MKYVKSKNSMAIFLDGKLETVDKEHKHFKSLCDACDNGDIDEVRDILQKYNRIVDFFNDGRIKYEHGIMYVDVNGENHSVDDALVKRIMAVYDAKEDVAPLLKFVEKLSHNPDYEAIKDVYRFLDHNELPIMEDGDVMAYKKVRADFTDCHSGKFDNSVGKIVEMPRESVEHNRERTCSSGLHFCSRNYLGHFGGDNIVVVKINPKDIVSIPTDYNNAKGRCCRYEVIEVLPKGKVEKVIDAIEENVVARLGNWLKELFKSI